jgi:hypothetical protein
LNLIEQSDSQRRVYIDTSQVYEAYLTAFNKHISYKGGMHWKKAKGREYLFRTRDRYGYGKSLGPRSPETEKIIAEFRRGKHQAKERLTSLRSRLKEQARFCKAALIQRVPRVVTAILRLLEQHRMLGRNIMVVGTNSLYAFEAAGGVFFENPIMATKDMDLLWDTRGRLSLVTDTESVKAGLMGILRKADRSFEPSSKNKFRAVNRNGYMVDLIKAIPNPIWKNELTRIGGPNDLVADEIRNLQWLISSPKFSQIVIGEDGFPAAMVTPDPRAFALHKLWLSAQTDREPVKKCRDKNQGLAVFQLVVQYLPQYQFKPDELRMFPAEVAKMLKLFPENSRFPAGIDFES